MSPQGEFFRRRGVRPSAQRLGCGLWGRLFLGYFFLAKQKEVTRLSGRDPTPKPKTHANGKIKPEVKLKTPGTTAVLSLAHPAIFQAKLKT